MTAPIPTTRTGRRASAPRPAASHASAPRPAASRSTDDGGRDPVLDLVRAGALAIVVAWHWAFTTLHWTSDGPHVGNPVGRTPHLWLLTWVLQVMPLFFLVGGALHARDRRPDREFVRNRVRRLVPPVLPLLGIALAAGVGAALLGRPDVVRGVVLMITPLWFLGVYLVLVAITPIARRVHARFGLWAIVVGALAVAVVDRFVVFGSFATAGPFHGLLPMLGEYVLTWAVVHQLGFHLEDLRRAPRAVAWATCAGGFALLSLGATRWGYPASMVGTAPDPISNMSPPNVMVVFLAVAQMGLLAALGGPLRRWAERHRGALDRAGAWSMTVYVWHMLALAAFWATVVVVAGSVDHTVDGSWWSQRPLWLLGPLLFAIPLFRLTGPRHTGPRRTGPRRTGPR